jgi:hypothetical protein
MSALVRIWHFGFVRGCVAMAQLLLLQQLQVWMPNDMSMLQYGFLQSGPMRNSVLHPQCITMSTACIL